MLKIKANIDDFASAIYEQNAKVELSKISHLVATFLTHVKCMNLKYYLIFNKNLAR